MQFNAIVHAPKLRPGARLNIAEADQVEGVSPNRLDVGDELTVRFSIVCPDRARGIIVAHAPTPGAIVLSIGTTAWTLRKGGDGINVPGLLSESWYVADEGTSFPAEPAASPL